MEWIQTSESESLSVRLKNRTVIATTGKNMLGLVQSTAQHLRADQHSVGLHFAGLIEAIEIEVNEALALIEYLERDLNELR